MSLRWYVTRCVPKGTAALCFARAGAERFFRRVRPDLVVLDCLLIGGDGLQLTLQLASEANVPVIVTSGDIEKAEQAVEAGLLCFQKPFRLSDLVTAVSNLLAKGGTAESSNLYRLSGCQLDRARRGGFVSLRPCSC
jgi:two-component system, OmpR family, response regulator MtrA